MNLHVFCKYLSVMLLLQCALSKMLPAIDGLNSELENVKSDETAKEQEIHSKKSDTEAGYSREKRAIEDSLNKRKQCAVMYKNEKPVGILQSFQGTYRLLPIHIEESIQVDISPIQKADAENIDKRDTENQAENYAEFSDDKYPYIFAKFKIDTKVDNQKGTRNLQKRESKNKKKKPAVLSSKHMSTLSSTLSRMQANEDGAEGALKSVLHDMGLIEDSPIDDKQDDHTDQKRDNAQADLDKGMIEDSHKEHEKTQHVEEKRDNNAQADNNDNSDESHHVEEKSDNANLVEEKHIVDNKLDSDQKLDKSIHADDKSEDDSRIDEKRDADNVEDENLELGTNKINMIRIEDTDNDRLKRENELSEKAKRENEVTKHYDAIIAFPEPKSKKQEEEFANEECDQKKESENVNQVESDERENKAENEDVQKEESENVQKEESEKLLFDDSEKDSEIEKQTESVESNERKKRSENVEKQMEEQIKQRLQKIKEEVKNEIEQLKGSNNQEFVGDKLVEKKADKEKVQRKKRNAIKEISSLEERETSDLDPVLFGDNIMLPHIRTRRKRKTLDADRQYAQFEKAINEETFKRNIAPLVEEKVTDASLMLTNKKNPANLVIDLNSQHVIEANERTSFWNNHKERQDFPSRLATTTNSYLIRSLKEFRGDFNSNYDDDSGFQTYENNVINEGEDESSREKKACTGKKCKSDQPGPKTRLTNVDGSNMVYFDGAPIIADSPSIEDKSKASMQILPSKGNSNIKTNILHGLKDGGYMLDLDPDIYKLTNSQEPREKRQASFIDLVAIHGGGPVLNHLLAIRKRSMLPIAREKRSADTDSNKMLSLTDMSDVDLFGDLPQSYEGELARYKRVKREK